MVVDLGGPFNSCIETLVNGFGRIQTPLPTLNPFLNTVFGLSIWSNYTSKALSQLVCVSGSMRVSCRPICSSFGELYGISSGADGFLIYVDDGIGLGGTWLLQLSMIRFVLDERCAISSLHAIVCGYVHPPIWFGGLSVCFSIELVFNMAFLLWV